MAIRHGCRRETMPSIARVSSPPRPGRFFARKKRRKKPGIVQFDTENASGRKTHWARRNLSAQKERAFFCTGVFKRATNRDVYCSRADASGQFVCFENLRAIAQNCLSSTVLSNLVVHFRTKYYLRTKCLSTQITSLLSVHL